LKVASTTFTKEEIFRNIIAVLNEIIAKKFVKQKNIQSLNLKLQKSLALPFYNSLPSEKMEIKLNNKEKKEKKVRQEEENVDAEEEENVDAVEEEEQNNDAVLGDEEPEVEEDDEE